VIVLIAVKYYFVACLFL